LDFFELFWRRASQATVGLKGESKLLATLAASNKGAD
jgi:hypothetical protein